MHLSYLVLISCLCQGISYAQQNYHDDMNSSVQNTNPVDEYNYKSNPRRGIRILIKNQELVHKDVTTFRPRVQLNHDKNYDPVATTGIPITRKIKIRKKINNVRAAEIYARRFNTEETIREGPEITQESIQQFGHKIERGARQNKQLKAEEISTDLNNSLHKNYNEFPKEHIKDLHSKEKTISINNISALEDSSNKMIEGIDYQMKQSVPSNILAEKQYPYRRKYGKNNMFRQRSRSYRFRDERILDKVNGENTRPHKEDDDRKENIQENITPKTNSRYTIDNYGDKSATNIDTDILPHSRVKTIGDNIQTTRIKNPLMQDDKLEDSSKIIIEDIDNQTQQATLSKILPENELKHRRKYSRNKMFLTNSRSSRSRSLKVNEDNPSFEVNGKNITPHIDDDARKQIIQKNTTPQINLPRIIDNENEQSITNVDRDILPETPEKSRDQDQIQTEIRLNNQLMQEDTHTKLNSLDNLVPNSEYLSNMQSGHQKDVYTEEADSTISLVENKLTEEIVDTQKPVTIDLSPEKQLPKKPKYVESKLFRSGTSHRPTDETLDSRNIKLNIETTTLQTNIENLVDKKTVINQEDIIVENATQQITSKDIIDKETDSREIDILSETTPIPFERFRDTIKETAITQNLTQTEDTTALNMLVNAATKYDDVKHGLQIEHHEDLLALEKIISITNIPILEDSINNKNPVSSIPILESSVLKEISAKSMLLATTPALEESINEGTFNNKNREKSTSITPNPTLELSTNTINEGIFEHSSITSNIITESSINNQSQEKSSPVSRILALKHPVNNMNEEKIEETPIITVESPDNYKNREKSILRTTIPTLEQTSINSDITAESSINNKNQVTDISVNIIPALEHLDDKMKVGIFEQTSNKAVEDSTNQMSGGLFVSTSATTDVSVEISNNNKKLGSSSAMTTTPVFEHSTNEMHEGILDTDKQLQKFSGTDRNIEHSTNDMSEGIFVPTATTGNVTEISGNNKNLERANSMTTISPLENSTNEMNQRILDTDKPLQKFTTTDMNVNKKLPNKRKYVKRKFQPPSRKYQRRRKITYKPSEKEKETYRGHMNSQFIIDKETTQDTKEAFSKTINFNSNNNSKQEVLVSELNRNIQTDKYKQADTNIKPTIEPTRRKQLRNMFLRGRTRFDGRKKINTDIRKSESPKTQLNSTTEEVIGKSLVAEKGIDVTPHESSKTTHEVVDIVESGTGMVNNLHGNTLVNKINSNNSDIVERFSFAKFEQKYNGTGKLRKILVRSRPLMYAPKPSKPILVRKLTIRKIL